ncbi:FxsA family protein [Halomonas sp. V046]|uniref:FxsA family protein n=1 Tax=Halomonas sp. V046 TaxID=3459611 RepID=UPI0040449D93
MPFLIVFTIFALLDFALLFSVGSQIGLLATIALVLATGFIGLHLIRREGMATFARAQERMSRGEIPSSELLTGAALIFGGALLMAPGFLSDALGFMCLIPDARRLMGKLLGKIGIRMKGFQVGGFGSEPPGGGGGSHTSSEGWEEVSPGHGADRPYRGGEQEDTGKSQDGAPLEGDFLGKEERRRR